MRELLLSSVCLVLAIPAYAANWAVDAANSKLTFTAKQTGETFIGSFSKFMPVIDFDEAAPEKGAISVTVDMASLTVEGKDRMDALPTADWFDTKKFPSATFTATSIRAREYNKPGTNNYIAKGLLTIRGISKEVELPFSLTSLSSKQGVFVATGELTLNRADYGIGQGRWASDEWVAFPVSVSYVIHASKR